MHSCWWHLVPRSDFKLSRGIRETKGSFSETVSSVNMRKCHKNTTPLVSQWASLRGETKYQRYGLCPFFMTPILGKINHYASEPHSVTRLLHQVCFGTVSGEKKENLAKVLIGGKE